MKTQQIRLMTTMERRTRRLRKEIQNKFNLEEKLTEVESQLFDATAEMRKLTVERRKAGGARRVDELRYIRVTFWIKGLCLGTKGSLAKLDLLGKQSGKTEVCPGSFGMKRFQLETGLELNRSSQRSTEKKKAGVEGVRSHAGEPAVQADGHGHGCGREENELCWEIAHVQV